jgi:hypothetical protein
VDVAVIVIVGGVVGMVVGVAVIVIAGEVAGAGSSVAVEVGVAVTATVTWTVFSPWQAAAPRSTVSKRDRLKILGRIVFSPRVNLFPSVYSVCSVWIARSRPPDLTHLPSQRDAYGVAGKCRGSGGSVGGYQCKTKIAQAHWACGQFSDWTGG